MNLIRHPHHRPLLFAVGLALALAGPGLVHADEIVYRDPQTCEEITVPAHEIVSETWTDVKYRQKARGPELSVPAALIVDVRRTGTDSQIEELLNSIGELERGNVTDARRQLEILSGGGYRVNLDTGKLEYKSFATNDPTGRRKRPPWTSEYAHFFYAKALYLEGIAKKDKELLQQAYLALVDQKAPGDDEKEVRTGGFLGRFNGGNSRWYPEAMLLVARTLVGLDRYDEAARAYKALADQALAVDIGPQWAYGAKLGPGVVAEARGKDLDAINAYTDTANFMRLLLRNETRGCFRRDIGRLFSMARMKAAGVMLRRAEKNRSPAEFQDLREFIEQSTPDALKRQFKNLPAAQREALVEGARDPVVQAVMQNGLGLAYLQEGKLEEAILAFRSVQVKYFQVPDEHARALHYLAQAAGAAAEQATGEARTLYESYRDMALERLRSLYPKSPWSR